MTPGTHNGGERIIHEQLLESVALCCIDGRRAEPVVGSPGGSLGELVVVAAAVEARSGVLGQDELRELLEYVFSKAGVIYHHTDVEHLRRLARELTGRGCAGTDHPERLIEWLSAPPAQCHGWLLDLLVHPDYVGCGHLAEMLREPEVYGVRRGLVEETMRTFFRLLWKGNSGLMLEALEGRHEEQSVVVVPSCGGAAAGATCSLLTPKTASSHFVLHPDAAEYVRTSMVRMAHAARQGRDGTVESLTFVANELADRQLQATVHRLAADLEHIHLEPCGRHPTSHDRRWLTIVSRS